MSEIIDLTNRDLGIENLGEWWEDFIARLVPEQATLYNESYNLIMISFPDSFITQTLSQILIDEALDTAETIAHVRILFIDTIVDALRMMGIMIDMDYVEPASLEELKSVLDTIYMFDGLTDLLGLSDLLANEELDVKERFIKVVKMVQPESNFDNLDYIIKEVSVNVIRGILIGLNIIDEDDVEWVDHTTLTRIKNNKQALIGTLANTHISNDGGVGMTMDAYMRLFMSELAKRLIADKYDYLTQVLSLMLISTLTDSEIQGQFSSLINDQAENIDDLYKANAIIEKVILNA